MIVGGIGLARIDLNQMYHDGINKLSSDLTNWKDFLTFSSQLHKYSFLEKVQIYEQYPTATYLASFDQWKLVNRFVTRNQKGIAITKLSDDGVKKEFLFDLSQTYGEDFVEPDFSLTKSEQHAVISKFYQDTFGENEELEPFAFEEIISKGVSSFIKRDPTGIVRENQLFIENTVLYALSNRLNWLSEYSTILDDLEFSFSTAEIDMIGKVSNEVTKHALIRISKLREMTKSQKYEEEVKDERRNDATRRIGVSRSENKHQSGARRSIDGLRENGNELSERKQSNARSIYDGRRDPNDLSSSKRGLGNGSRDQNLPRIEKEEFSTGNDEYSADRKTQSNASITSQGNSHRSTDKEFTNESDELRERSFQQLNGSFPNNRYLSFKWYEGNKPMIYISNDFKGFKKDYPEIRMHDDLYEISEVSTMRELFSIKPGRIETKDIDTLYQKFRKISEGKNDFEFERDLFHATKRISTNTSGRSVEDNDIEWYQNYLKYLNGSHFFDDDYDLIMTTFTGNPCLSAGVAIFPDDKTAILQLKNTFHKNNHSQWFNEKYDTTDENQGLLSVSQWMVIEKPEQETVFEFQELRKITVRDCDEFKKLVETVDGEVTEFSFKLEYKLLRYGKDKLAHLQGEYLNDYELKIMNEHLTNLNPFSKEEQYSEVLIEKDPRVVPLLFEEWKEFEDGEGPVEDDGALYLDTDNGVQPGQIEVRGVGLSKFMYRFLESPTMAVEGVERLNQEVSERQELPGDTQLEEVFLDHSCNILESDEYLREINGQYYLYIDNGSYCIEVDSNKSMAAFSLYKDIDPRKVDKYEEYGNWQKLNIDELSLKHTNDPSFQEKYIGVFDDTIKRFIVDAAALKIVDNELYWRPENNQPDKYKVVDNRLISSSNDLEAIPKRKITHDNFYLYSNGKSSLEVFLKNGMHVLTLTNLDDEAILKILNEDPTAKINDVELYVITEGVELFGKLEESWSYSDVLEIIKKNVTEIIDRNSAYKSLFGLPIVEPPNKVKVTNEQIEITGVEQSLFDFSDTEAINNDSIGNETNSNTLSPSHSETATEHDRNKSKNYFPDAYIDYEPGKRKKAKDNLAAIKLLNELELSKREVTIQDQEVLAKYSGWGGIPEIFDEEDDSWNKEHAELKQLLSSTEFDQIRSTVLTAFYTDPRMIEKMYQAALRFGDFSKGNILDPAMGTGNFYQALPKKLQSANLKGIEIDPRSYQIAKTLYPDAELYCKGFEDVAFNEKMDLIIGNFPFNNIKVLDKKYDKYSFVVHDYFMAKSIDSLEQNGLLMFITSAGTMDKKDSKAREYLAKRAKLIGGVRLPKTAFKQSAGTEVISDILIFQKKTYVEMVEGENNPSWLQSVEHPNFEGLMINQYFLENPDHILGSIQTKNFHGTTIDVFPDESSELTTQLEDVLDKIISKTDVKEVKINPKKSQVKAIDEIEITVPEEVEKYSFFMVDDRVFYHSVDGKYEEFKAKATKQRIKYMLPVKEAVQKLLELQQNPYEDSALEERLSELNHAYDVFVDKVGYFNDTANMRVLRDDLKFPLLLSLEKEIEGGYEKQPIFFKATVRPKQQIVEASTARDAVRFSMTKKRTIDFEYIATVYPGRTVKEIVSELEGEVFFNPAYIQSDDSSPFDCKSGWEIKDEYLTGNVKQKLDYAKHVRKNSSNQELTSCLDQNILALEEAQPERLLAGDIKFQIGSTWIPVDIYNEFMYTLFEAPSYVRPENVGESSATKIDFLEHNATWKIARKGQSRGTVISSQKFGTDRIDGYDILEATLNLQQVTVKDRVEDPDGKVKYVINPEETMIAKGKQSDIENEFQKWLFKDSARTKRLVDIYNDRFNVTVPREFSGEDLAFDEMNIDMELRLHQKDVIARILYDGRALMAHEVGAGKTAAMLSAGMYLKQNGLINKPMYVVPNHLTDAWGKEILTFYPNANVLITSKKDFEKKNRQEFVSKIATGDYDAVIIGHSQFERIPLSKERQRETIETQISEIKSIVYELKEANAENWTIKDMERFKANLETTLKKLDNADKRDEVINFEDLGIDFLFVDEAHIYKNLFTYTKMQNVAGVGSSRSQRASDMLGKVRYIQECHEGRNVVFATGTPISNSMSEMYVMQYFLQPEALISRGLKSFDAWAATFGQVTSSLEITPEGSGYRMRNRFSKFYNLPELMKMFFEVADIQTADMLNLPTPELENGKVRTIVTKRTKFQEDKMEEFVKRSERIRNGAVDPRNDNMLKLTNEAKLMAIDPRLIDETLPRDPESKLSICAEETFAIWERTKDTRSTQIIFSDSGTPKENKFNVYDELKDQLIEKGVPKEEIAFIHDAKTDLQRDTMFEKVRNGDIRVILGSTSKLGTGTNIQDKLIHAHHIDCPWKPSDLTQREGRILRQGNENEVVGISRYVTKGTFDSYLWQIQEQKLTYISQIMNGKNINRSMDDITDTVLTAAEVKAVATDNPLLSKKMEIDNKVARLQIIRSQWESSKDRMDKNIREVYPLKIAHYTAKLEKYRKDQAVMDTHGGEEFQMTVDDRIITDRSEAFEVMMERLPVLSEIDEKPKVAEIGTFRGLEVMIEAVRFSDDHLILKGESTYRTTFNRNTGPGNITRLINLSSHVEKLIKDTCLEIEDTEEQLRMAEREIVKPFSNQEELDQLLKEQQQINNEIELETMRKESGVSEVEQTEEIVEEEMSL